jgi:hypothetical protein
LDRSCSCPECSSQCGFTILQNTLIEIKEARMSRTTDASITLGCFRESPELTIADGNLEVLTPKCGASGYPPLYI